MQPISETALASVDDHPIVRSWLYVELIKKYAIKHRLIQPDARTRRSP